MNDCIFCKIAEKKLPAKIVYEDNDAIAFDDINPQAPIHVLVIPKKHFSTLLDFSESDSPLLGRLVTVCRKIAEDRGIAHRGFRISTSCNPEGGQVVFHLHFHLLGGRQMHGQLG